MGLWSRIGLRRLATVPRQLRSCDSPAPSGTRAVTAASHCLLGATGYVDRRMTLHWNPSEHQLAYVRLFAAPASAKKLREKEVGERHRMNEEITAQYVRLVSEEGHGIVSRGEAISRAKRLDLDLVEVDGKADPPVCKLMDFHKEKFKKDVRDKELSKAKADTTLRKGDCKEVHFTGKIEQKDLEMKADIVRRLMERGYRVKVVAEAAKKGGNVDAEKEDLNSVLSRLYTLIEDVSALESAPRVEKRTAYLIVRHAKFGTKKNPVKKSSVNETEKNSSITQEKSIPPLSDDSLRHEKGRCHPFVAPPLGIIGTESFQRSIGSNQVTDSERSTARSDAAKRNTSLPTNTGSVIPEPSPPVHNRYRRIETKGSVNRGRPPPPTSFAKVHNGQADLKPHHPATGDPNFKGRMPFQVSSESNNQPDILDLKHHNSSHKNPDSPISFGNQNPHRSFRSQNPSSPAKNLGSQDSSSPPQGYGIFSASKPNIFSERKYHLDVNNAKEQTQSVELELKSQSRK